MSTETRWTLLCPWCGETRFEDGRKRCRVCGADETDEIRRRKREILAELRVLGCFDVRPWKAAS